jgi:hypothetical protein
MARAGDRDKPGRTCFMSRNGAVLSGLAAEVVDGGRSVSPIFFKAGLVKMSCVLENHSHLGLNSP